MIFGIIEFWHPIRVEGRQNLTEYQIDLKMVSKQRQRILMKLQLLFESVLIAIFVTNSVNMLGLKGNPASYKLIIISPSDYIYRYLLM